MKRPTKIKQYNDYRKISDIPEARIFLVALARMLLSGRK